MTTKSMSEAARPAAIAFMRAIGEDDLEHAEEILAANAKHPNMAAGFLFALAQLAVDALKLAGASPDALEDGRPLP